MKYSAGNVPFALKLKKRLIAYSFRIATLLMLVGCATNSVNIAKTYYQPNPLFSYEDPNLESWSTEVKWVNSTNLVEYMKDNYELIGESAYYAGMGHDHETPIRQLAAELQADLVLCSTSFKDTVQRSRPVFKYVPGTSNRTETSGTFNSAFNGGYGSGSYNSTSRTYTPGALKQTSVEYSQDRKNVNALYLRKHKPLKFGFYWRKATPEEIKTAGTNFAVTVLLVHNNGRFYNADILDGDIITKINGEQVIADKFDSALGSDENAYEFTIVRGEKVFNKTITIE
jgi:hypothetical protein